MNEEYTTTRFVLSNEGTEIPGHFFIVTEHNPFSPVVSDEKNAQMNEILRQQIEHET